MVLIGRTEERDSSLKVATGMFAETLDNTQHSTRLTPESQSYT
jgi:hypothetical protein